MTDSSYFIVTVEPSRGPPFRVDLGEFAIPDYNFKNGITDKRRNLGQPFTARPGLAREFAAVLKLDAPKKARVETVVGAMRQFFRFLDGTAADVSSSSDVAISLAGPFREWLRAHGSHDNTYAITKSCLNKMRALTGSTELFWPSRRRTIVVEQEPFGRKEMVKLSHALRHHARSVKAMLKEGQLLASNGTDPRVVPTDDKFLAQENRAWLVRELMRAGLPDKSLAIEAGAQGLFGLPGADYIGPAMDKSMTSGLIGQLRWFAPSRSDTAVFMMLFLLATGWNVATTVAIDVSASDQWLQQHPLSDDFVVIRSFKHRAGQYQFAISQTRAEWHPFRLLQYVIDITAPLRREVIRRLSRARAEHSATPTIELSAEVDRLEKLSRTPWLYLSLKDGVSGYYEGSKADHIANVVRHVIEEYELAKDYPRLDRFTPSDARDSWIGHAFVQSGYQFIIALLASQHIAPNSLKHYIGFRRYRAYSEKKTKQFYHLLFSEIEARKPVDPTRLRLLVRNGAITPEQESRLMDYRQRTRLGMGCIDPRSPDKHVAPHHPEGAICRVQRCIGCSKGIVFYDSLPSLARAFAELRHLRRLIPMSSWEGSFAHEHDALEQTLEGFDSTAVTAEVDSWMQKFSSGEIQAHGTYPDN